MGDALLKAVSRRLGERLRPGDTVARLGGDEFTLLLADRTADEATTLLLGLVEAVRQPLLLDGHELAVRICIGITSARSGDSPEELIRRADVAMYAANSAGGDRWTWFDPIMLAGGRGADPLTASGARPGVARRLHPAGRAQRLHRRARRWILREVVRQAAEWEHRYGDRAPSKVSVNISARQLREPGFTAEVADFGTGQSSLSLLVETPVKILKVDKSFVDGVETAEQAERLHQVGYQLAQGFHFARPMPAEDVALLIATREMELSPLK